MNYVEVFIKMTREQLVEMKRQMISVGNFKEVERINKILSFQ
jgi:hypothetical protein